jgi:hypothetical protein
VRAGVLFVLTVPLFVACSDPDGTPDTVSSKQEPPDTGTLHADTDGDTGDTAEDGPRDVDGDGYNSDVDCDDFDDTVYPGAPDEWYDGEDSDCAGNSDYDQDGDGYLADHVGGDDCDDLDASVHPDAAEVWYDGIDQACDGGNDYDQDGDGDPIEAAGGGDCNDLDPTVSSLAREVLGDGVDRDCEGSDNGFWMYALDTARAAGLQGPRLSANSTDLEVTFLADSFTDPVYGRASVTGSFGYTWDEADPWAGQTGMSTWSWGTDAEFGAGFDFFVHDDYSAWAYGLVADGTRYLYTDIYEPATGDFTGVGLSWPTSLHYTDVELSEAADGSLHVAGVDPRVGHVDWIHGTADDFASCPECLHWDYATGVTADSVVVNAADRLVLAGSSASAGIQSWTWSDTTGLATSDTTSALTVTDLQWMRAGIESAEFVAAGPDGVDVTVSGVSARLTTRDAITARGNLRSSGRVALAYTDGSDAVLAVGDPTSGFVEVVLATGLLRADDADAWLTSSGQVVVCVRGGDDAVLGIVEAP